MKVNIWTDGAAMKKPNPGPAGAGYVIEGDGLRIKGCEPLGRATNNVAEYEALLRALRVARQHGAVEAHVRIDSKVVYGHIELGHRCNYEHLRTLLTAVREEVDRYAGEVTFERIPREENKEADALAKAAKKESAQFDTDLSTIERRDAPGRPQLG